MSYAAPFVVLSLCSSILVGGYALNLMKQKSDLENSALACARIVGAAGSSACDKEFVAKAKALQAKARVALPES